MGNVFAFERGTSIIRLATGSSSAPSLAFASAPGTGIFLQSATQLAFIVDTAVAGSFVFKTNDGNILSLGVGGGDSQWNIGTTSLNFRLFTSVDNGPSIGTRTTGRPGNIYAGAIICAGSTLVQSCQFLATTCVALAIRNGANTGTLTNSPTTGNPEVWAQVNNNGCTYVVPLWRYTG